LSGFPNYFRHVESMLLALGIELRLQLVERPVWHAECQSPSACRP
jgi:hypothetical protein